jgi:hypothetical protein
MTDGRLELPPLPPPPGRGLFWLAVVAVLGTLACLALGWL